MSLLTGVFCVCSCLGQIHTIRSAKAPAGDPAINNYLDELTVFASQSERNVTDLAKGTYLAARFYSSNPSHVPQVLQRFKSSSIAEEAMLSGLFVTLHGKDDHLSAIREELENSRTKQYWMNQRLGTIKKLGRSIDQGREWESMMGVLPATDRCTKLSILCMQSADPLVRRFGLYSGYWFGSPAYWSLTSTLAEMDTDVITRQFARYLAKHPQ